jgi:glucose dehydrogenase
MGYEINAATNASARGVAYWPGDNRSPASIFFGTSDGRLVAASAATGKPMPGFGAEAFSTFSTLQTCCDHWCGCSGIAELG